MKAKVMRDVNYKDPPTLFGYFGWGRILIGLALFVFPLHVLGQSKAGDVFKIASPSIVLIRTNTGGGSGFLVSSNGLILTALHVVDGASRVSIKTHDGVVYSDVSLLAKDQDRDIALLKIAGSGLMSASLKSETIREGDPIIVLGNPLALEALEVTISTGILSGIRKLNNNTKVLQITAPISPGNSGGPVLSESGNVVGVVSFKITKGESLNFAIPIEYCRPMISNLPKEPILKWSSNGTNSFGQTNPLTLPSKKPQYNLTGYWQSTRDFRTSYIKDDGVNIEVWSYGILNYKGKWEGDFVLTASTDYQNREIFKPIDSSQLMFQWMLYKEKGGWEKILKEVTEKANKLTPKSAREIWNRVEK